MTFRRVLLALILIAACVGVAAATDGSSITARAAPLDHAPFAEAPASDPMDAGDRAVIQYLDALKQTEAAQIAAGAGTAEAAVPRSAVSTAPDSTRKGSGLTESGDSPSPAVSSDSDCANPVVPEAVARRESGCNWNAYNAGGCGGRGCIGFYQLDAGHFAAVSPWNPNVSGICYGLSSSSREGQTECASRLGASAWL